MAGARRPLAVSFRRGVTRLKLRHLEAVGYFLYKKMSLQRLLPCGGNPRRRVEFPVVEAGDPVAVVVLKSTSGNNLVDAPM